jgi:DNA-binding MarR family transcriptional regulator
MDNDPLKLENQLCFPLYAAAKAVVNQYKPFLDAIDLTYTQYLAMLVLWEHEQIGVKELGTLLYLDSGTLTPVLKRLEAKGYVQRSRDDDDQRAVTIRITAAGEALKAQSRDIPRQISQCLPLSADEALNLYQLLYQLLGSLDCQKE